MSDNTNTLTLEEQKLKNFIVEFYGPTNILNDGKTENTLTIGVKNSNVPFEDENGNPVDPDVTLKPKITIISIWFAVSKSQGATNDLQELPWAVTTVDSFDQTTISVDSKEHPKIQWNMNKKQSLWKNGPYSDIMAWEISPKTNVTLRSGEHISVVLTGLKTSLPDGPCFAYSLIYASGKEDQFKIRQLSTLQKTPIHFSQGSDSSVAGRVGIGKAGAEVMLDVAGGMRVRGGDPWTDGNKKKGYYFNSPGDNDSGMSSNASGHLGLYVNSKEAIQINENRGKEGTQVTILSKGSKNPEKTYSLLKLEGNRPMEFGAGLPDKQEDNGKIGYQTFSDGLDIVGAGTTDANRKLSLHADDVTFQGKNIVNLNSTESINLNATGGITLKTANDANINLNLGEGKLLVNGMAPIITVKIDMWTSFQALHKISTTDYPVGAVVDWIISNNRGGKNRVKDKNALQEIGINLFIDEGLWNITTFIPDLLNFKQDPHLQTTLVFFHKSLCKEIK